MVGAITSFLIEYSVEIACSTLFLGGFGAYNYIKKKGKREHKLVYWNVTDRIVKSKKLQQQISDRAGGSSKNGTFFKTS